MLIYFFFRMIDFSRGNMILFIKINFLSLYHFIYRIYVKILNNKIFFNHIKPRYLIKMFLLLYNFMEVSIEYNNFQQIFFSWKMFIESFTNNIYYIFTYSSEMSRHLSTFIIYTHVRLEEKKLIHNPPL